MPQIDLKFSDKLDLNFNELFTKIEKTINTLDSNAGICKCRAYPVKDYNHDHVLLVVFLMQKPHRDKAFMENMLKELDSTLKPYVPKDYSCSIELKFLSDYYLSYIA